MLNRPCPACVTLDAELHRAAGDGSHAPFVIAPLVSAVRLATPETISPALVRVQVATSKASRATAGRELVVRATGAAAGRAVLFVRDNDRAPWRTVAPRKKGAAEWRLPLRAADLTLGVAATPFDIKSAPTVAKATMGNDFTLTVAVNGDPAPLPARLACRASILSWASSGCLTS